MEPLKMETYPGNHISNACKEACRLAIAEKRPVTFEFNGIHVNIMPGDTPEAAEERFSADMEAANKAYREDPQRKVEQAEAEAEHKRRCQAQMRESAKTEAEMREATAPTPYTKEQLTEYVESLVKRTHDYGTCVYAMSMAATAAFNYVAHELGVTGFQASCADLDILRRTRSIKGPFILLKGEDALYPQYDLPGKLAEAMDGWKSWLKEEAKKKLAENSNAHPNVVAHWERLASMEIEEPVEK